ncbi:MAG: D-alanyl-D-alanine carboxypeptidase [Hespellia sp.]|nr:D-alanyl-D-alanine carboxypeptidase [Hespellia sp.]
MWKKGLIWLLAAVMFLTMPVMRVNATQNEQAAEENGAEEELTEEEKAKKEQEEAWQKIYDEAPQTDSVKGWPEGPKVWAEGAILMDMKSGAILYAKNSEKAFYPASITKLLTALVALQNAELTDVVTGSDSSYDGMDGSYASLGLQSGEQMSLEDALYGLLFASANEFGHAIGESVTDGGYEDFISKMNEEVTELGGVNSNFVNTNGIQDENHYTCAYDMALIGAAVYQIEAFRNIESNLIHDIPATNMSEARIGITQHDKMMLPENSHYCEYIKAGKTGYTDAAKSTLVSMADNGTLQLVCVDLSNGKAQIYDDTRAMCDYGFANFKKLALKENETSEDIVSFQEEDAYVVVPKDVEFSELEAKLELEGEGREHLATVSYTYKDQPVGHTEVTVSKACYEKLSGKHGVSVKIADKTQKEGSQITIWNILLAVAILIVVLFVILCLMLRARKKRIMRAKRRHRMRQRRENGEI